MPTDLELIRRELLALASRKSARVNVSTQESPCHWSPQSVHHPETGDQFTTKSAWEFIVELLEGGANIEEIVLDLPPGRKGYVIKHSVTGKPTIYIKLQLGSGIIIGRSFHNSIYD